MAGLFKIKDVNSASADTKSGRTPKAALEKRERKKYHYPSNIDKENIETLGYQRKSATFDDPRTGQNKNLAYSGRHVKKLTDSGVDRLFRPKGLSQGEVETAGSQKFRRYCCPEKVNVRQPPLMTKAFTLQPRFVVYKENDLSCENASTSSSMHSRQLPCTLMQERQIENLRVRALRNAQIGIQAPLSSINQKQNYLTAQRTSINGRHITTSNSIARVTPADIPGIPRIEENIKEVHRKAWIEEKRPVRERYDILSLELAYNTDYMDEYMRFQIEIDAKKRHALACLKKRPTSNERIVIVKYLIRTMSYHKYPSFVLYQTVKIFDAFINISHAKMEDLQLIALASLWIALKKDLTNSDIPSASMIIALAGNLFQGDKKPLIACEKEILMKLNFEISFPDPFSMFALYTVMLNEIRDLPDTKLAEIYYFGSYMLDLSLLMDKMCQVSAIHLSAVAAEVALLLATRTEENLKNPQFLYWRKLIHSKNPGLQRHRLSDDSMNVMRSQLLDKIIISKNEFTDYHVVFKKYKKPRYGAISQRLVHKVTYLYLSNSHNPFYALQRHSTA